MNLKNFITRALTAAVYVALIFGSLLLGAASFGMLCLLVMVFSFNEYFKMVKRMKIKTAEFLTISSAAVGFSIIVLNKTFQLDLKFVAVIPLVFLGIMIRELFNKTTSPFNNIAYSVFGFIYIFIPISSLYYLGFYNQSTWSDDFHYELPMAFFLLIWANDTGAYIVGSAFGKHKLFERISPKKTIEGALGGLLLTMFGAWVVSQFAHQVRLLDWIFISIIIVIFGTTGDLFESLLKRKSDVKDSGKLIPGHGGILDRFDSILFAAPVVFIYLVLLTQ